MTIRQRITEWVLASRVRVKHPTLRSHHTVLWDYGYDDLDALEIGQHVSVGAFCEIICYRSMPTTPVEGKLVLGHRVVIGTGCNLRAAGGAIIIGEGSNLSQYTSVIAANHVADTEQGHTGGKLETERTGVTIGRNVWVGAGSRLLPGISIGDSAIVGAGSVVTKSIPSRELWAGNPARKLKEL